MNKCKVLVFLVFLYTLSGCNLNNLVDLADGSIADEPIDYSNELNAIEYSADSSYGVGDAFVVEPNSSLADIEFSISPDLPSGVSLDPSSGVISGTPLEALDLTSFTVTITKGQQSVQKTVNLTFRLAVDASSTSNTGDSNPGDGICDNGSSQCTLRAAIEEANAQSGPTVINLAPGTYALGGTPVVIGKSLEIKGVDRDTTIIDGGNSTAQMLQLSSGVDVIIDGISITQASCTGSAEDGCGIKSNADQLVLKNCKITNNSSTGLFSKGGGVFHSGGGLLVDNCLFEQNESTGAGSDGGALMIYGAGEARITNSTFSVNQSGGNGGAIGIQSAGGLILDEVLIDTNSSSIRGGGVYIYETDTLIDKSQFISNVSNSIGGGGFYQRNGSVTVADSTFDSNSQTNSGKGLDIYSYNPLSLIVKGSTFRDATDNVVSITIEGSNEVEIFNSTFYNGHTAVKLEAVDSVTAKIYNNTISANRYFLQLVSSSAGAEIHNNVVAGSVTSACFISSSSLTSLGFNIIDDASCSVSASGDLENTDPLLVAGAPQDNGGPTETILLQPTSPAIDSGDNSLCSSVDQRGQARPVDYSGGPVCDRGAVEMAP